VTRDNERSATIGQDLVEAADIIDHEPVHVLEVSNRAGLITNAIRSERSSGVICISGAGGHLVRAGDNVIIAAFVQMTHAETKARHPSIVLVDPHKCIRLLGYVEQAGTALSRSKFEGLCALADPLLWQWRPRRRNEADSQA